MWKGYNIKFTVLIQVHKSLTEGDFTIAESLFYVHNSVVSRGISRHVIAFHENIFKSCDTMFLKTVGFIEKRFSAMKSSIFLTSNRPIYSSQYQRFHIKVTRNVELVGKFSQFPLKQLIFFGNFFRKDGSNTVALFNLEE